MDNLFNSKPIHNVSLIDCRERNKQQPIMNSPKISKHSSNVITKSLKAFLKRLKGSNIRQETQAYVPNRDMLPFIIIEDGEDNTLVPSPSIYYKPKSKPVDLSSRDSSNIRHSLDLSTLYNFDSQQGYAVNDYEAISNRNGDRLKSAREDDLKKLRENALQGSLDEEIQRRLWNEDATFCSKEKISEWLGTNSEPFRVHVLHLYMQNFDFKNKKLDEAFRMLCSKLYLKAESQQLDRILEAFAKRFHECNPTTLLHSVDVVHAVAYSLLLLNTDLHVVSNKGNRMTRSNFIKNTMETVQTLMFPQIQDRVTKFDSSDLYSYRKISPSMSSPSFGSFKSFLDDHDLQPSNGGILLQTLDVLKSNITWKSSKSNYCPLDESLTRTQRTWLLDIESLLKEMYNEVKAHRIDQAEIKSTNISQAIIQRSKTLPKSEHRKVLRRRRGHSVGTKNKPLPPIPHQKIETEFSQMPAHEHKQGIVMRKCVMEAADKKARNRQWQLCYLISSETELMMYRPILKSDSKGMRRKSMIFWHQSVCPSFSLQDIVNSETDEWQPDPNQPPLAAIPLNHCYATSLLPPGWNGQRPHVFRLETADGGLWMFETTDLYAVQAWVEAINHAAALISKSPMQGAVCNIDYGWDCGKSTMMNHIAVWHPPTPCMIQSTLSLNEQYKELKSQIRELAQQLDQHRLLKPIIDKKSPASYRNQAIVNWDKKFHYVSNELTKLRCYRDVLKQKVTT